MSNRITQVWLVLMLATGASWWLGTVNVVNTFASTAITTVLLMLVAFFKIRLVINYFMEVRHAPVALRILCEIWVVGVCGLLIGMYLIL